MNVWLIGEEQGFLNRREQQVDIGTLRACNEMKNYDCSTGACRNNCKERTELYNRVRAVRQQFANETGRKGNEMN